MAEVAVEQKGAWLGSRVEDHYISLAILLR